MKECTECGRGFYIDFPSYSYKVQGKYQCSYTCYDHALLRLGSKQYLTEENYINYVIKSEKTMIAQGKTILHPIKIEKWEN